jgi:hypothetical protein
MERTFRIPSDRIVAGLSHQRASQLLDALEICTCRENEVFRKRGCPSIVPQLLIGEFSNLEHLFDDGSLRHCAKSIEKRGNCDRSIVYLTLHQH